MAPYTPETKNTAVWAPAAEAGGAWSYNQAGVTYNQAGFQYNAEKPATVWANDTKN